METAQTDISTAIRNANDKFETSFGSGEASRIADLYTEDGMLLPTGSDIVSGKEGVRNFWQGVMDMGVKQVKLDSVEIEQHGDTAIELGNYTLRAENSQIIDQGKYMVVWKKQQNQWKIQKDIWNTNQPAQEGR